MYCIYMDDVMCVYLLRVYWQRRYKKMTKTMWVHMKTLDSEIMQMFHPCLG